MIAPRSLGALSALAPALALALGSIAGCGEAPGEADAGPGPDPVVLDSTEHTYTLSESSPALPLWTTPATRRIAFSDRPPREERSGLTISAARREYEPAQLALGPASGSATVRVEPFPSLGGGQLIELSVARDQGGFAEVLEPLEGGAGVTLSGLQAVPIWITVRVPEDAPAGMHETTVTVTPSAGSPITLPLRLYVFDFALPEEIHFYSQLNLDVGGLVGSGTVDEAKSMLFRHRFTPKSVPWPSGFRYDITWENPRSSDVCGVLWDEPDEGEMYSIGSLGPRYLLGEGWNGIGFPTAMLFQFVDNSTPRPATFCGIDRGDHYGSDAYNAEWSEYLGALEAYLRDHGMLERGYYYVQNEPQDAEDHRLAAYLCQLTRAAAPELRIAVSEEARPEIAEHPEFPCGYDIWIAHIPAWQESYALERARDHGEESWWYSLPQDAPPYFNPTKDESLGMEARVIPWAAFASRVRGYAYYDFNLYFHDRRPGVRAELFREGFEDYEYLWLANGGAHPGAGASSPLDGTVRSVASSPTSWTRDADALMALRHQLGLYIEGTRDTLPVLEVPSARPRGDYFVNFQDPSGPPTDEPLVVEGQEQIKVGWMAYDEALGYGFYGEHVGDPIAMSGYDATEGYDERQRSYLYDDYGRPFLFEFALAPGRYEVTVGVGRPARGYPGDPHNVTVEGEVLVNDEPTTDAAPTLERSVVVELTDGRLSIEAGGRSASTGDFAYTFLAYLEIRAVD